MEGGARLLASDPVEEDRDLELAVRLVRDGGESESESRREGLEGVESAGSPMMGVTELRFVEIDLRGEGLLGVGGANVDQTGTGTGATVSGEGTATEEETERLKDRRESSKLVGKAERGGEVGGERFVVEVRGRSGVAGRLDEGGGEEGGEAADARGECRGY